MPEFVDLGARIAAVEAAMQEAVNSYAVAVQSIADRHRVHIATGHMSDMWQVRAFRGRKWMSQLDDVDHPAFDELRLIDAIGEKAGIGPCNLERYAPRRKPEAERKS